MNGSRLYYLLGLATAVVLILLSGGRSWREVESWTGLETATDISGVVVREVTASSPAEEAGLLAGDRIIEIAGSPVASKLVADDLLARVSPGRVVGLHVLRRGIPETVEVRTFAVAAWHWDRVLGGAVALVFCLGGFAVVIRPRRRSASSVYALWCLAGAIVLGVSWTSRGEPLDWVLFWLDRGARLLFPALWIHLVVTMLRSTRPLRRWMPVVYAPALALLLAEVHLAGLGGALRAADPVAFVDALQSRIEMAWLSAGLLAGLAILVPSAFRRRRARERARARWLIAGLTAGVTPFVLLEALPLILGGRSPGLGWLVLPPLAIVPVLFTGAVVEYRLMDLALFGRRALALFAMLTLSLLLFLGLYRVVQLLVPPLLDPPGLVPILLAAVITAALAPAVRAGTEDLVGRIYYRKRYNFRRALARVARELNAEQELSRLSRVLEEKIAEALNASPVWLLLIGEQGELSDPVTREPVHGHLPASAAERLTQGRIVSLADVGAAPEELPLLHRTDVQVLVPLRLKGRLIAILAVGPRSAGGLLDSDDLDLLRSVAAHASAAVAGAQSLDQLRDQVDLVRRLKARTEALIDGSPIGMAVVDNEGCLRHWNPAIASLLGRDRVEVLGTPYTEALPVALQLIVQQALRSTSTKGSVRAYRVRVASPGGDERELNVAASRLTGAAGDEGLLLSLDDVTEQARLEQKLIQQDRLASVGLLAAGVAHEVNTPLTGISSYAQILLEETGAGDPRRPLLEKVVAQAQRASRIARGLLTLSRPGPKDELVLGPIELGELCEETLGLIGPQIRKASATVYTDFAGVPVVADADRSRLQQVLMNLLLNALDAVGPGGKITVRTGLDRHGRPLLEVEDDGHGIPAEVRDRIFDPFFTTKGPGRSTGLGLSISYAIVREHGGTLSADSKEGQGTRMRVVLPSAVPVAASRLAG